MSGVHDRTWSEYSEQTTPSSKQSSDLVVTVTHPHHPLYKQRVEVIRVRRGSDPDLVIRLPNGLHAAIAASCTDYASETPLESVTAPLPLLDLDGLCQIRFLIDQLRQRSFSTIKETGAQPEPPSTA